MGRKRRMRQLTIRDCLIRCHNCSKKFASICDCNLIEAYRINSILVKGKLVCNVCKTSYDENSEQERCLFEWPPDSGMNFFA